MTPPVPWILPEGYHNPNATVPDFPEEDDEAGGPLDKGSGSVPLTGPSAEVTVVDGAEEEDKGFETVDDGEEPGDKVVISIPAKEVAKPEGSCLTGKTLMFESEEEEDPTIKEQIEATLEKTDLLGELMLSDPEDESESESSNDNDYEDPNATKRYYEGQEETGEPGSKPSSPKAADTDPAAVPESAGNPTGSKPDVPSGKILLTDPGASKGKGPSNESSGKAPASNYNFQPRP